MLGQILVSQIGPRMVSKKKEGSKEKVSVKEKLLNSAYELFNRDGIHKTGIDKIIKNAGVAKMSLYAHFSSKQDLVVEYLKIRDEEWFDLINSYIVKASKPEEKLLKIFEALEDWFDQDNFFGCPFINGMAEFEEFDNPTVSSCISQHFDKTGVLVEELLTEMKKPNKELVSKICMIIVGAIVLAQASRTSTPAVMAKEVVLQLVKP